ncbi:type II toxin-antitoxin system HicB family antitoxin [Geminocystis sp. CENA526]|uniref:type II toxin-antitoxin system HicB family antitoxin n=1 Tax=Geminocystis sp. CENA526 TaxID=1355871 RepID=UPI003D6FC66A
MKIKVLVWQEDDVWCASVPSLKGCHTWGETYEQMLEMVKEAIELYLDDSSQTEVIPEKSKIIELAL